MADKTRSRLGHDPAYGALSQKNDECKIRIRAEERFVSMALLRGKLSRDQENMEDVLTSNVFGVLKYIPLEAALIPFLSKARTPGGEFPLASLSSYAEATFEFWPWLEEPNCTPCEPDLLIRINYPHGEKILVLIEAKYRSGKSSEEEPNTSCAQSELPPKDQLSREWKNLKSLAEKESAQPVLIYLTADIGCPTEEIEASQQALENRKQVRGTICWLSWRHLPAIIVNSEHEMLRDLAAVLHRLSLIFLGGFSKFVSPGPIRWTFVSRKIKFNWGNAFTFGHLQWEFRK